MPRSQERQQAREAVAAYHQANLAELLTHVADAMDRFRDGEVDAFEVDHVLFQYSRAAKELWKFCNLGNIEIAAHHVRERRSIDWWERGAPRTR
jgi:hypothetical protein